MVHVYIANILELPDPKETPILLEGLPQERKEKTMGYRYEKNRKQSLCAGIMVQKILKESGLDEAKITYGIHGKPETEGIYFNLSHSQDYVVCVVGDKPVGCDVERIGQIREGVAERFFTKKEVAYLNFHKEEKVREFYRIWTMKESYLKMTGEGITFPINRVEIELGNNIKVYRDGEVCNCYVKEYELPGYCLSVCAEDEELDDTFRILRF